MSQAPVPRTGRSGAIVTAAVVVASAVGVIGWYLITNRTGPAIDATGFDLSATPESNHRSPKSAPTAPVPIPRQAPSSLGMLKADAGIHIVGAAPAPARNSGASPEKKKEQSHADFTQEARRHEADVRRFTGRMAAKYPLLRQYGKDWNSYPDLRKLNHEYRQNHDPVAFLMGLSKAPNFGKIVAKYATSPEIREYVTQGVKETPGALLSSGLAVLKNDRVIKGLIASVAGNLGLPPTITAMINGGGDPAKLDQSKIVSDLMKSATVR